MCGISGAFSRYSYIDLQTYYIAHSLLKHRGPDGEGFAAGNTSSYPVITYSGDNSTGSSRSFPHILSCRSQHKWILGHHRLSIIDLSDKGHQPMASPDKRYWLVYNGEIYNYRELRADLENLGCEFHTQTDTEVVVYALSEWGIDAFSYFNGMWALAWYDTLMASYLFSLKTVSLMKEARYFSQNRMTNLKNVLKAMLKQSLFHVIRVAFHIRHSAGPGKVFRYPAKIHAPVFSADPFESNLKENLLYNALPEYLRYEDRNSMSYSLETRLPFLDYRLVEWAFTLPSNFKITHGKNKAIVRDAVSSYVPSEIIDRKDKMGFVSPQEIWQRELLKPLIEEAVHGIRLPFLHYRRLRQYYEQYQNRSSNDWPFWWRISSLYSWMNSV